ncbi:hypothetical protein [Yoonia sp. I 8.24]|uniref:hypothetical protein n=1 Tax=Yoonia sp. I 8.24 TaxID=1537229 RepID=UPI001EDF2997|nr:hypothetical protein [Yoonia sp. I 8.24]MCG3269576.1 hypothetical protein [Yoonia sp. I 8.24]
MKSRSVEGSKLDVSALGDVIELSIETIRKPELEKLQGLDELPLEMLALRWLSAADLTVVPFPKNLIRFRIWHSSKLKSLKGLETAENLKELYICDNGSPLDISALHSLTKLEHLIVDGGYGDGNALIGFDALEGLPIEQLTMINIKGADLDLGPVARLPKLKELDLPTRLFPAEEVAKVAAAKPWYYGQLKDLPKAKSHFANPCKKCGQMPHELFLKGKKFLWCLDCQGAKVADHLADFDALVSKCLGRT